MPRNSGNRVKVLTIVLAALVAACSTSGDSANKAASPAETRNQLEARAHSGNVDAQFLLGFELCCGQGDARGQKDIPRATTWLCRAATQGDPRARFHLGRIYADGLDDVSVTAKLMRQLGAGSEGKGAKPRLAAMWFDLAMASGHPEAARHRLMLTKSLTREDVMAVEKMRARWREQPCEWRAVHAAASGLPKTQ